MGKRERRRKKEKGEKGERIAEKDEETIQRSLKKEYLCLKC